MKQEGWRLKDKYGLCLIQRVVNCIRRAIGGLRTWNRECLGVSMEACVKHGYATQSPYAGNGGRSGNWQIGNWQFWRWRRITVAHVVSRQGSTVRGTLIRVQADSRINTWCGLRDAVSMVIRLVCFPSCIYSDVYKAIDVQIIYNWRTIVFFYFYFGIIFSFVSYILFIKSMFACFVRYLPLSVVIYFNGKKCCSWIDK